MSEGLVGFVDLRTTPLPADMASAILSDMARRHRIVETTPDLFSAAVVDGRPTKALSDRPAKPVEHRYVLPGDLGTALTKLADDELKILANAVEAEVRRRRPRPELPSSVKEDVKAKTDPVAPVPVRRDRLAIKTRPPSLTQGRINAIRAALKAGVKPSMIARQFGVSQSVVRRVLSERDD